MFWSPHRSQYLIAWGHHQGLGTSSPSAGLVHTTETKY